MILVTAVLTVVVFIATTAVQRFFVHYEPTVGVLAAVCEIQPNRPIERSMFKTVDVPINLIMNLRVVKKIEEVKDCYSTEPIHKGEILRYEAMALKNEIKIIEVEKGKEKNSIKIKAPENAVSYQIKTGDRVSLYFTGRYGAIKKLGGDKEFFVPKDPSLREEDYCTIRILEDVPVLGIFDENGQTAGDYQRNTRIDTIVFSVGLKDSILINNLKGQGVFDITGLPYK